MNWQEFGEINHAFSIECNPHREDYRSVREYFAFMDEIDASRDCEPEDMEAMVAADMIWEVRWYPSTPIGFCIVAAATLERAWALIHNVDDAA